MLNRKYYKVSLSTIDFDKTKNTVDEMNSSNMLDVINNSSLVKLRDVIVYKTIFGKFRELITGKEIAAITEYLEAYSKSEHCYDITLDVPVFFKCNVSKENDTKRRYQTLDQMIVDSNAMEEYLIEHLGTDKKKYASKVYDYLYELYNEEDVALDKYNELLRYYGLEEKGTKRDTEDKRRIKSLIKKYGI